MFDILQSLYEKVRIHLKSVRVVWVLKYTAYCTNDEWKEDDMRV